VVNTINLIGYGHGTCQPQARYAVGFEVTAGDLNPNGKLDLAVCRGGTSPAMSVLLAMEMERNNCYVGSNARKHDPDPSWGCAP
jgi:hypothetical protein